MLTGPSEDDGCFDALTRAQEIFTMRSARRQPSLVDSADKFVLPHRTGLVWTLGRLPSVRAADYELTRMVTAVDIKKTENRGLRFRPMAPNLAGANPNKWVDVTEKDENGVTVVSINTGEHVTREDLLPIIASLLSEFGKNSQPSLFLIDKNDRYGFLPMILPGEVATRSLAQDLSPKAWLEWWLSLDTIFETVKAQLPGHVEEMVVLLQTGYLSAATEPVMHGHLFEQVKVRVNDFHAGQPGHKEELARSRAELKPFNGEYLVGLLKRIAVKKFRELAETMPDKLKLGELISVDTRAGAGLARAITSGFAAFDEFATAVESGQDDFWEKQADPLVQRLKSLRFFLHMLNLSTKTIGDVAAFADNLRFTEQMLLVQRDVAEIHRLSGHTSESQPYDDCLAKLNAFIVFVEGKKNNFEEIGLEVSPEIVSPEQRHYPWSLAKKIGHWRKVDSDRKRVKFSDLRPVLGGAFMTQIAGDIQQVIQEEKSKMPAAVQQRLKVKVTLDADHEGGMPGVEADASAADLGHYYQQIFKRVGELMNAKWEEIFELVQAMNHAKDEGEKASVMTALDACFGLSDYIRRLNEKGIRVQTNPKFVLESEDARPHFDAANDVAKTTENYLKFFGRCVAFGDEAAQNLKKNTRFIHGSMVCPRGFVIGKPGEKMFYGVFPGLAFDPIAPIDQLEQVLASEKDLQWIDSRLRILEASDGAGRLLAKASGAEAFCAAADFPFAMIERDKKTQLSPSAARAQADIVYTDYRCLLKGLEQADFSTELFVHHFREELDKISPELWPAIYPLFDSVEGEPPLSWEEFMTSFLSAAEFARGKIANDISYYRKGAGPSKRWEIAVGSLDESHGVVFDMERQCVACGVQVEDPRFIHYAILRAIQRTYDVPADLEYAGLGYADVLNIMRHLNGQVKQVMDEVHPMFQRTSMTRKAHLVTQWAIRDHVRAVMQAAYKKEGEKTTLERSKKFVPRKHPERPQFAPCETNLRNRIKVLGLVDFFVEERYQDILGPQRSDPSMVADSMNASFSFKYTVLEKLSDLFSDQEILDAVERGDNHFIQTMLNEVVHKLLVEDGLLPKKYHAMLTDEEKRQTGYVEMLAEGNIDLQGLREYMQLRNPNEHIPTLSKLVRKEIAKVLPFEVEGRAAECKEGGGRRHLQPLGAKTKKGRVPRKGTPYR